MRLGLNRHLCAYINCSIYFFFLTRGGYKSNMGFDFQCGLYDFHQGNICFLCTYTFLKEKRMSIVNNQRTTRCHKKLFTFIDNLIFWVLKSMYFQDMKEMFQDSITTADNVIEVSI